MKKGDSRSMSSTKRGFSKGTGSENVNKVPSRGKSAGQRNSGKIKSYTKPGMGLKGY